MITHTIHKGFDIKIAGRPSPTVVDAPEPTLVAVQAKDEFPGIKPKLLVAEGDAVRIGQPLFFDKLQPATMFVAPVAGRVSRLVLGPRRWLRRVEIERAEVDSYHEPARIAVDGATRDELIAALQAAGLWPFFRQRPVGRIADPAASAAAIYVNGMDSEPLAADPGICVRGLGEDLRAGSELLRRLTDGKVYLTVRPGQQPAEFQHLIGVEVHAFAGPHPAGLVGTHIHEIAPLRGSEVAWCLRAQELAVIGAWVRTGRLPTTRVVAVAGTRAPSAQYFRVRHGAPITALTGGAALASPSDDPARIIAGTVLSGVAIEPDDFLGHSTWTVTIMPDGAGRRDLFGWALPQLGRHSASRAVASWLAPKASYDLDARLHGGPRPIVNIGAWERVLPLDIHPTYLVRAIQAGDLEEAIHLGLLEVTEEDVALCTFVDPCKTDVGAIIRRGLDQYEREG